MAQYIQAVAGMKFDNKLLLEAEKQLLMAVDYEVHHPSIPAFLTRLLKAARVYECRLVMFAQFCSDLVLLDKGMLLLTYKEQAAAIVYTVLQAFGLSITPEFLSFADETAFSLQLSSRPIVQLLINAASAATDAVTCKYSRDKYYRVAQLPLPASLLGDS